MVAHQFLVDTDNDPAAVAQILRHENLNTTTRYAKRAQQQLGEASGELNSEGTAH